MTQASIQIYMSTRHSKAITSRVILVVVDDVRYTLKHVVLGDEEESLRVLLDMVVPHLHATATTKGSQSQSFCSHAASIGTIISFNTSLI